MGYSLQGVQGICRQPEPQHGAAAVSACYQRAQALQRASVCANSTLAVQT